MYFSCLLDLLLSLIPCLIDLLADVSHLGLFFFVITWKCAARIKGERRTCLSDDRMKVYQNTLAKLRLPHVCEGGPCSTDIRVCNTRVPASSQTCLCD